TDTAETTLGVKANELIADHPDESTMYLVAEGTEAFLTRMALLSLAERTVDAQYFIWKSDLIGKLIFKGLIEAADRGVRVRLLLDDITLDAETEENVYVMDQHENIEVRIYNSFATRGFRAVDAITNPMRLNRRMHNKSFTFDSQYTVVGGRNIENNYFSANVRSNYADLDIIAAGPVVKDVDKQFDIYWNSRFAIPVKAFEHNQSEKNKLDILKVELSDFAEAKKESEYAIDLQSSEMYQRIVNGLSGADSRYIFRGDATVIYDDPDKTLGKSEDETVYMTSLMRPHIEKIEHSLELISPYFVPGEEGTEYMGDMVKRGIRVRVITNSLSSTDGIMAQSGYARQRIELLKAGVEIYELKATAKSKASRSLRRSAEAKSALHAKTYIFDRKEVYIGSFNFDPRSAKINTELGVICAIPEMAEFIASTLFDEKLQETTYKVELIVENEVVDGIDVAQEKVVWVETVDGKEIRHMKQPETSAWRRFNENIYSILPIESQL
ncbi:MAG: phospholipase D family protein, partial [Proteobacteria bacterium]|nr:phospholipase D family protein [Pseudomonadota bacterium]